MFKYPKSNQSKPYPVGFFVCQFHRSRHMVFRSCFARNPSSLSATLGSAVKSGTSPRLKMNKVNRSFHTEVRKTRTGGR